MSLWKRLFGKRDPFLEQRGDAHRDMYEALQETVGSMVSVPGIDHSLRREAVEQALMERDLTAATVFVKSIRRDRARVADLKAQVSASRDQRVYRIEVTLEDGTPIHLNRDALAHALAPNKPPNP